MADSMERTQPVTTYVYSARRCRPSSKINVCTTDQEPWPREASLPHPRLYLGYSKIANVHRKYPGWRRQTYYLL